ncbi:hypothetical protein [Enterovirga rhinocerotis]|uniref:Uncharacterized protein n=1 Tax=Enterovirga rhinocerotis TaxID=1339210 RepID=A0A4R7BWR5_9HYPH|nr:hypothetical protein [Enterovirga rhinocerotis]TDR90324.1 hypothetical protein EV668_3172 [Enterovirga rhinocerotis]
MARGRPKLSEDEKARRKEDKAAQKAAYVAENALAKMPADREKRIELFDEAARIKTEQQSAAGSYSAQIKRMHEVFGLTKEAIKIRGILAKCRDGVYEATVQQVQILLEDINRPFQLSMFAGEPGQGETEAPGAVFDNTTSGQRQKDVQPQAAKAKEPPAAPSEPRAGLPLDEAQKRLEEAKATAESKRAGKKASAPPPAPVGDADEEDLRPRHLRQADQDRDALDAVAGAIH